MVLLFVVGAGKDAQSPSLWRSLWAPHYFCESADPGLVFLSIARAGSISRAVCQRSQVDPISLPLLPFLYLAGGYAVQQTLKATKEKALSRAIVALTAVILVGWPLVELHSWAPYYSFYLNSIGGEKKNITRYFAMDEVSEFDTREVAQKGLPIRARWGDGRNRKTGEHGLLPAGLRSRGPSDCAPIRHTLCSARRRSDCARAVASLLRNAEIFRYFGKFCDAP